MKKIKIGPKLVKRGLGGTNRKDPKSGRLFMYQEVKTKPDSLPPTIDQRNSVSLTLGFILPLDIIGATGAAARALDKATEKCQIKTLDIYMKSQRYDQGFCPEVAPSHSATRNQPFSTGMGSF